jgi:hypothetical protein
MSFSLHEGRGGARGALPVLVAGGGWSCFRARLSVVPLDRRADHFDTTLREDGGAGSVRAPPAEGIHGIAPDLLTAPVHLRDGSIHRLNL